MKNSNLLSFWEYDELQRRDPYYQYAMPANLNVSRLVIFLKRLWFITDYVIMCDLAGNFLSQSEVADPSIESYPAALFARQTESSLIFGLLYENGRFLTRWTAIRLEEEIEITYSRQVVCAEDINLLAKNIGSMELSIATPTIWSYFDTYREYLKATERFLYDCTGT